MALSREKPTLDVLNMEHQGNFSSKAKGKDRMRVIVTVIGLCLAATAAFAASEDELMATSYGNTLVVRDTFGTSRVHYNKDHTFMAASWLGDVSGHWKIENGKMCVYAEKYPLLYKLRYSIPECDAIAMRKVGDKWASDGREYELVQGILK